MSDSSTREKLIETGIRLFGEFGLEAVGTRALADAAGARQSAISYHFETKERLYVACAEHIAADVSGRIAPLLAQLSQTTDPAQARVRIEMLLAGLVTIMMRDDIAPIARFVVREQMNPTLAFDVLWDRTMRHMVEPLLDLLGVVAGGRLPPDQLRVRCFSLIGQIFAFRFGRASLMRITGWNGIGEDETASARDAVLANARAIMADLGRGGGS